MTGPAAGAPVVALHGVGHRYGAVAALRDVDLEVPAGALMGVIGPDGVGKSTLLGLIAGVRRRQAGTVRVLGGDIAERRHRERVLTDIAYMPQGLGHNLYPDLTVVENIRFFARLFGVAPAGREARIARLLDVTGLAAFPSRRMRALSGGMKQKLGLCCALVRAPALLVLDEPTTGIDPLSRRGFWELIAQMRAETDVTVLVATAYMDEAAAFDTLVMMDDGAVLARGAPGALMSRTGTDDLEAAYAALLPAAERHGRRALEIPPRPGGPQPAAIEAVGLSRRFGRFTAVDDVSFEIERGEIFGFVGPNGCGKTTTMTMVTGLLPASAGEARLLGRRVEAGARGLRRHIGYMSQQFSLYGELTGRENLELHGRLFDLGPPALAARIAELVPRFGLEAHLAQRAQTLPLGVRQRLALAVAVIHLPEVLILDEPTSGVDPLARDAFWRLVIELSRARGVTIFISTHYLGEAERCDRVALMNEGRLLACDTPQALVTGTAAADLEGAFVARIRDDLARRARAREGTAA